MTSAGTFSARIPRPRRPWPKWLASRRLRALVSTFSTFRGQPGLYLEDIFVKPAYRGRGIGKALLAAVARLAVDARLRPAGVVGAELERTRDRLLPSLGARPMDEWTVYRIDDEAAGTAGFAATRSVNVATETD